MLTPPLAIASAAAPSADSDFRAMFELAPVSLWLEDYSALRGFYAQLRAQGVTDLAAYFVQQPNALQECATRIRIVAVNQHTLRMYGARDLADLQVNLSHIFEQGTPKEFDTELITLWRGELAFASQSVNLSLDKRRMDVLVKGRVMPGHEANWGRVMIAVEDITERVQTAAHLAFLASHDGLTQVRSRAFYSDYVARLERQGPYPVAITVLDLNGLKQVNDDFGHGAGDALLRRAGAVLKDAAAHNGTAARLGGDEFVIVWPRTDAMQLAAYEARILALIADDNRTASPSSKPDSQSPMALSFAIGGAVCQQGERLELTERLADQRMFEAKRAYYETHDRRRGRHSNAA
jgi:diguanylate cyclase (GGDEF)-like protein